MQKDLLKTSTQGTAAVLALTWTATLWSNLVDHQFLSGILVDVVVGICLTAFSAAYQIPLFLSPYVWRSRRQSRWLMAILVTLGAFGNIAFGSLVGAAFFRGLEQTFSKPIFAGLAMVLATITVMVYLANMVRLLSPGKA